MGLQGVDRAMVIAAQAFTALIPLLILASALSPGAGQDSVAQVLIRKFDLSGDAAIAVRELFTQTGDGATGGLSVLLLVFSGFSLTRRMQRMYLQAWRLEAVPGIRGSVNAAMGLAGLVLEIALLAFARSIVRGLPLEGVFGVGVSVLAGVLLWTSVPWLLLDRRVTWQRLLPAGALVSLGSALYGAASGVYMPRMMASYSERYGLFGVTLALVGWLLTMAFIVVGATVVGAELDRAPEPWARRIRHLVVAQRPGAHA